MIEEYLKSGLERGFIDHTVPANDDRIPRFITNDPSKGEKVITSLREEMRSCDSFMFSVAFVTYDGINALLEEFKHLRDNNIRGRILASQYQNFTDPKALRKLLSLGNIELRIVTEERMRMHSKCYIFSKSGTYDVILGSSNLTNNALCTNGEWNVRFNSLSSGEMIRDILNEYEKMYSIATPVTEEWISTYETIYKESHFFKDKWREIEVDRAPTATVVPNRMQVEALDGLQRIRDQGGKRALVISATGSGKTYLSAFDAKRFGGKFLYLVHRRPILNKSMKSFEAVFGNDVKIERFDPNINNLDVDCLFSTIQTMSKSEVLYQIPPEHFDYILIDEVHHIGASTYRKIVDHFKPKFLAGMTATPDRTDGFDIYRFFDYNIAYEIRLKQAMEYNLTCPFHYFGVSDISIDGVALDDDHDFSDLEFDKRVDHVIENAEFYGHGGDRLRGLVFCRGLKEAERFSTAFNRKGYRTVWVSGSMNKEYVEDCIERLESDEGPLRLDYIFTADLFNEGVDIPPVNQVIMLRPTESAIVYIQQLGRGLRLHKRKDFVTILDFIGNYDKNYFIPIALSDDHSYNKSEVRRFVSSGDSMIYGDSTISFDEVSKNRLYESIDNASFSEIKLLMEGYNNLKAKLGKVPKLTDFSRFGSIDALNILSKYKSYHEFLTKKEKDYTVKLSDDATSYLEYLTKIIAPGKRHLEIEVLELINNGHNDIRNIISSNHPELDDVALDNIESVFNGNFYKNKPALIKDGSITETYSKVLKESGFIDAIDDLIELGKENNSSFEPTYRDTNFVLNKMYTYDDVCRLMNWSANENAQNIGGYRYNSVTNTFSVFINYVKGEDVVESQRYEDHFENRHTLIAQSKSNESRNAKNMVRVRDHIKNGTRIHLFVRKNKNDEGSKEFYYLGEMDFESFINDERPVKIRYILKDEVRSDLYDYFNSRS